ncbi:hypothetical protein POM88_012590 [Heracleum sosnowskyi]|uniref:Uncharacterized protein n=1 Tax=Heracleum sosnowskyi TaxID=360622 RepID=A0AAD8IWS7_9APIA|nr:hypothetical protein POM88_012590 [Heracleum sosnowskyi]
MFDTKNEITNDGSISDNDSDYFSETESSEDDCSSLGNSSDEELNECRQSQKGFKEQLASEKFRDVSSHESSFESDELRSIDSSSEDEITRKGFIGDNLVKNKRSRREKLFKQGHDKEGTIKFETGLKFLSMDEFRTTVRHVCGGTGHGKNKCPNPTPAKEFRKDKGKTKETAPIVTEPTNKPKRTYKPKRKACTPWRTKTTSSQASDLKIAPRQRNSVLSSCVTTKRSMNGEKCTTREGNGEDLNQDF